MRSMARRRDQKEEDSLSTRFTLNIWTGDPSSQPAASTRSSQESIREVTGAQGKIHMASGEERIIYFRAPGYVS